MKKWYDKLEGEHIFALAALLLGSMMMLFTSAIFLFAPKPDDEKQFMANVNIQNNLSGVGLAIVSATMGYLGKTVKDNLDNSNNNREEGESDD